MKIKYNQFFPKPKFKFILNSLIVFIEFSMLASVLIFCLFVIKGFIILGHIPFYGDKEVISYDGIDRKIALLMLYPVFYGIPAWTFLTICKRLLDFNFNKANFLIGLTLVLLNMFITFTSQFSRILD